MKVLQVQCRGRTLRCQQRFQPNYKRYFQNHIQLHHQHSQHKDQLFPGWVIMGFAWLCHRVVSIAQNKVSFRLRSLMLLAAAQALLTMIFGVREINFSGLKRTKTKAYCIIWNRVFSMWFYVFLCISMHFYVCGMFKPKPKLKSLVVLFTFTPSRKVQAFEVGHPHGHSVPPT